MSELQQRHEFYELREQHVAEQYWPVGEAAETFKAELIGLIIDQRIKYSAETAKRIKAIYKILDGTFEPPKEIKKGVTKEQMKQSFGI